MSKDSLEKDSNFERGFLMRQDTENSGSHSEGLVSRAEFNDFSKFTRLFLKGKNLYFKIAKKNSVYAYVNENKVQVFWGVLKLIEIIRADTYTHGNTVHNILNFYFVTELDGLVSKQLHCQADFTYGIISSGGHVSREETPVFKIMQEKRFINSLGMYLEISNADLFVSFIRQYLYCAYQHISRISDLTFEDKRTGWDITSSGNVNGFWNVTKAGFDYKLYQNISFSRYNCTEDSLTPKQEMIVQSALKKNPELIWAFIYNVMALSMPFIQKIIDPFNSLLTMKRVPPVFTTALFIYGDSNLGKNKFANVFFNSFLVNKSRLQRINAERNLNLSLTRNQVEKSMGMYDIPILVFADGGLDNTQYRKVQRIINSCYFSFPVFLSKSKTRKTDVLHYDISGIKNLPSSKEELIEVNNIMNILRKAYISFFATSSEPFLSELFKNAQEALKEIQEKNQMQDLTENDERMLGMIAATIILMKESQAVFLNMDIVNQANEAFDKMLANKGKPQIITSEYIKDTFADFVRELVKNSSSFNNLFWEGLERSGKHEACIYIQYDKLYTSFLEFCGNMITEAQFHRALKEYDLIKMRADGSSIGVMRSYEGRKIYVLAVYKDKITPTEGVPQ